ncbi:hypothetical protein [Paracnuella aquatica]|uniref:hypothetical protein n=1 Tax=Paracnuella aquatica TaxID=2268757 RepID=UPI000DEF4014|nr:hypothetical protein [Paracnuella aquatica]RPD51429.1 hypothetical protein DRJ53_01735 [Paracnuella aquatica]
MSSRFDLLATSLLQKPFADCSISELQQLIAEQPYLAPAQFLLAKKMTQDGVPEARAQMQKAALYYHQPPAFDAFLNPTFPEAETFYEDEETDIETGDEPPLPEQLSLPEQPAFAVNESAATEKSVLPEVMLPVAEPLAPQPQEIANAPEIAPELEQVEEVKHEAPATHQQQNEPATSDNTLPAFEPYHTIDYFASQGIRLSQEEAGKDKMGRQLKSFTEWLKTMKRLPATEQLKDLDPNAEKKVEHMAAHSVVESEIVTEAMAEVWIKQGNLDKAEAVYHKLSLSNPSKRAYFAAKLESLKKNV